MVESFKWKNSNHYILQFKAKSIFLYSVQSNTFMYISNIISQKSILNRDPLFDVFKINIHAIF